MSILKDILKETVIFGAVGALLAVAAPAIAVGLSLAPTMATASAMLGIVSPAMTAMFFGAFGGIAAGVRPLITNTSAGIANHIHHAPAKETGLGLTQHLEQEVASSRFRDQVKAELQSSPNQTRGL